jgi:hypothetical protein
VGDKQEKQYIVCVDSSHGSMIEEQGTGESGMMPTQTAPNLA